MAPGCSASKLQGSSRHEVISATRSASHLIQSIRRVEVASRWPLVAVTSPVACLSPSGRPFFVFGFRPSSMSTTEVSKDAIGRLSIAFSAPKRSVDGCRPMSSPPKSRSRRGRLASESPKSRSMGYRRTSSPHRSSAENLVDAPEVYRNGANLGSEVGMVGMGRLVSLYAQMTLPEQPFIGR